MAEARATAEATTVTWAVTASATGAVPSMTMTACEPIVTTRGPVGTSATFTFARILNAELLPHLLPAFRGPVSSEAGPWAFLTLIIPDASKTRSGNRAWKISLIEKGNPNWVDL